MSPVVPLPKARYCGLLTAGALALACGSATTSHIHVNQAGYLPQQPKRAVLESASSAPQSWQLVNEGGDVVSEGVTVVRGPDPESGDQVHWIDLSGVHQPQKGLRLRVGADQSDPFDIEPELYHQLKYDALAYFYQNRSGIPISMPWARDFKLTRPAGHVSDSKVGCVGTTCDYSLNVKGGWYDAGDHGKYVVNGGIAVWTLLNLYEREKAIGTSLGDFNDGKLKIPESGNGVNDLLDEARWEVEFLLAMQVPEGQEKAGLAHHKVHDNYWTPLGLTPAERSATRRLYPPSTAATLNLVAVGAQCARIWRELDPAFAGRCRSAAVRGWNAAFKFPNLLASPMSKDGGGPYDDTDVSDEFFWAASELYVTLGDPRLLDYLRKSKYFGKFPHQVGHEHTEQNTSFSWQSTQALGAISLAFVPNQLPAADLAELRAALVTAAEGYLTLDKRRGYPVPMEAGSDHHYPWGSSSFVANNALVLALAADLTNRSEFKAAVVDAMDYLLGRNPLGFSYVSGYGERSLENPHHRFWAHQRGHRCPMPPPGALAGGPNSKLQDPTSKRRLNGCAVQKCYIDNVDAWAVNEVAINWNAPLAWVAAYLDELATGRPGRPPFSAQPGASAPSEGASPLAVPALAAAGAADGSPAPSAEEPGKSPGKPHADAASGKPSATKPIEPSKPSADKPSDKPSATKPAAAKPAK